MAVKHSSLITCTTFFLLFVCHFSTGAADFAKLKKFINLNGDNFRCSRSMPCNYAVCPWERQPTITRERCIFINSHCVCPSGTICALSDAVTPGSSFTTFEYHCRRPEDVLSRS
ncbi:hypothetical protein ACJMK2_007470 [Sinanodonta woodiana]|uniref:Uncharacterized protein n=1 Tax=Sinanodonta woodiana TaxID=1069815 RepID=A0ABD3VJQ5_SINWO